MPPFDPLAVPSPLVQVKASLKDERRDDVVFVVSGDTPIDRWPVAVMSDYDGVVWTVADPERDPDAAEFVPVDTQLPELDDPLPDGTTTVEHTVEIVDLGGSFLPAAGTPRQLTLPGDLDPRMNLLTGTVALPGGVTDGLTYEVTLGRHPGRARGRSWRRRPITPVDRTEELELLPPPVRNLAADLVEGQRPRLGRSWRRSATSSSTRASTTSPRTPPPGHSYGRIAAMLEDPDRIVGFEEQYAAAAAVMAQVAELPVRVVVGYRDPGGVVAQRAGRGDGRRHRRRGSSSTPASSAGSRSTSRRTARGHPTPTPRAARPSRSPSPTRRRRHRRRRRSSRPARRRRRSTARRRSSRSSTSSARAPGCAPWAVDRRRRGRRAARACSPLFALVVIGVEAGAPARAGAAGRRRRAGSPVRGPRPSTAAPRPARPRLTGTTPQETVGVYAGDGELVAVAPALRTLADQVDRAAYAADAAERRARRRRLALQRRGRRRAAPAAAARRGGVRMMLDPRPLLRDESRTGSRR